MKRTYILAFVAVVFLMVHMTGFSLWAVEPSKLTPAKPAALPSSTTVKPAMQQPATIVPQINIVAPADGTSWYLGETNDITWVAILPAAAKLTIELILPGGKKQKLAETSPSPSKFAWNITQDSFSSQDVQNVLGTHKVYLDTNVKLKLTAVHEGKTYEAESNVKLLVPTIKITSPNEGAVWNVGKTYTVTWQKQGPLASTVDIFIGGGGFFIPSFYLKAANTGSASITLPASALFPNWTQKYVLKVETTLASQPMFGVMSGVGIDLKP